MKKLILPTILTLSIFSFNAESGTFNLSGVSNTNELFLSRETILKSMSIIFLWSSGLLFLERLRGETSNCWSAWSP